MPRRHSTQGLITSERRGIMGTRKPLGQMHSIAPLRAHWFFFFFLAERVLDTGKYFEGDQDNLFPTKEKIVR